MFRYPDVTLLITHYNRSTSLERLLKSFADLNFEFGGIVVSDDGSKPHHISYMEKLQETYHFKLVKTPVNKGLGNNINKGQDAVTTEYTLYVQEDFVPQQLFTNKFGIGLQFLKDRKELDMVRFYAYTLYPHLVPVSDGFSEMKFRFWDSGYQKFYFYSDHPHLRRTNFFDKFGRYPEGIKVEATEYRMMMSFLKNKGRALFFEEFTTLFEQKNSEEEPSTVQRTKWRDNQNFAVVAAREVFRHIKFYYNYLK